MADKSTVKSTMLKRGQSTDERHCFRERLFVEGQEERLDEAGVRHFGMRSVL
jgi:hypothetical protein